VFILGFPFGDALSTSSSGPNVTIGKGTISSIRHDDFGDLKEVQVDGDINPGNSGGPIVFADGKLMGVSVATVLGTQIGLGIPSESVSDMLQGRVGQLVVTESSDKPKSVKAKFVANLIDPLGKLKSVSVLYVEKEKGKNKKIGEDGRWKQISNQMKEVKLKLKVDEQKAVGEVTIKGDFGEIKNYLQQVKFTNSKGETFFTSPVSMLMKIARDKNKKSENSKGWISQKGNSDEKGNSVKKGWLGEIDPDEENESEKVVGEKSSNALTPSASILLLT